MALFEFDLARVEDIVPWGTAGDQSLSWFALTDGWFRMRVGHEVLFQYTNAILSHWGVEGRDADYQIAAFARDILGSVAAGAAPLPKRIEQLASDWDLLTSLQTQTADAGSEIEENSQAAWRWLGERSPWTSYLVANPSLQFVRIGDDLRIHWDNRKQLIDNIPVWTAQHGSHVMPVSAFLDESRDFMDRLLNAMADRIAEIEAGAAKPQVGVDVASLRREHETWRKEFASYFGEYKPEIAWEEAEKALGIIAAKKRLPF